MKKIKRYQLTIGLLLVLVLVQFFIILRSRRPLAPKGRIAIVLDDWGYNLDHLGILAELKFPLTVAVLPNLAYSGEVAQRANSLGKEVILHLPLEPRERFRLEQNTIATTMSEEFIQRLINWDLEGIRYARGVSNHMGSRVSEDSRTLGIIFQLLKKRNLYFLDSYVTSRSLAQALARKYRLKFARRDIFLDNRNDAEYIRAQLQKLKTRAQINGQAIAVGHDRRLTLEVLKEAIPEIEKEGYGLVFVSELAK
jgi:polysaccharide deacetylase 2 family uncharacterized protein YibQ